MCIVNITGRRRAEGQEATSDESISGEAGFDEMGVSGLEVSHGGAAAVEHGEEEGLVGGEPIGGQTGQ